jgi:hypothetical protein
MVKGDEPPPAGLAVQLAVRLTSDEQAALARLAWSEARSLSAMARVLIREGLRQRRDNAPGSPSRDVGGTPLAGAP